MPGGDRYSYSGTAHGQPTGVCSLNGFRIAIALFVFSLAASAAKANNLTPGFDAYLKGDYAKAYAILSPAATADNPFIQNLVALSVYYGRGTAPDTARAHALFHSAAERGVNDARRNLGILHSIGAPGVVVDHAEARSWFNAAAADINSGTARFQGSSASIPAAIETVIQIEFEHDGEGKRTYLTFCSGCHGFSGMRFFPFSPSFAMGERMTKSNAALMQSILNGKGMMPSWKDKLPRSQLEKALGYLRELALRTGYGTDTSGFGTAPELFFIFNPPGNNTPFEPHWHINAVDAH